MSQRAKDLRQAMLAHLLASPAILVSRLAAEKVAIVRLASRLFYHKSMRGYKVGVCQCLTSVECSTKMTRKFQITR